MCGTRNTTHLFAEGVNYCIDKQDSAFKVQLPFTRRTHDEFALLPVPQVPHTSVITVTFLNHPDTQSFVTQSNINL